MVTFLSVFFGFWYAGRWGVKKFEIAMKNPGMYSGHGFGSSAEKLRD